MKAPSRCQCGGPTWFRRVLAKDRPKSTPEGGTVDGFLVECWTCKDQGPIRDSREDANAGWLHYLGLQE